jgi:hypothetical protein
MIRTFCGALAILALLPSGRCFGDSEPVPTALLVSVRNGDECGERGAYETLTFARFSRDWLASEAGEVIEVKPGQAQLFLDDQVIATMEGLQRTMHQPAKRGALIRSPQPDKTLQTRSAPAWDPGKRLYSLWVLGIDDTFWQSKDGLHWTPGSKPNIRTDLAVHDPVDPNPARRFKAALANEGFAISADGVAWTKLNVPRVPSSDEANLSYDPDHGTFIHTVKRGGKYGRSVAIATSRDFKSWMDLGVVFQADELDQKLGAKTIRSRLADATLQQPFHVDPKVFNVDVYNMGVFHYEGLYIGLPALYHATGPIPNYPNTDGFHVVQLAVSRDLKQWQRLGERRPFIGPSRLDSGAYDLTQILPPSAPIVRGDELWFYYTGLKYRASYSYIGKYPKGRYVPKPQLSRDPGAVCLAVLRRDGFISLDGGDKPGTMVTKPFQLRATKLLVNVDAGGGDVTVAILDEAGKPLPGYSEEEAASAQRIDEVRWQPRWKKHADLSALKNMKVRLKFTLRDAKLYSFRIGEAK